jgi:hypothetical protein
MSTDTKDATKFITTNASHFRTEICPALLRYIAGYDAVKVCSAWFTCPLIIAALEEKEAELIIGAPGKLDPSSPEFRKGWSKEIYDATNGNCYLYYGGKDGHCHHKFIVFGNYTAEGVFEPLAVSTGSYNFTISAKFQMENITYIVDKVTAKQYLDEFNYVKARCQKISPQ